MKRIAAILLVLLASSASAQIPGQLDSLRARVLRVHNLSTYTATTTAARVWQALNDAQTPVCQDFDAFEKWDTVTVGGLPEGGVLNTDFLRVAGVFKMIAQTRYPLVEIEQDKIAEKISAGDSANYRLSDPTQPRYFFIHGDRIATYPKDKKPSNMPDSLLVNYWAIGHPMLYGDDSTDIYPHYREALILKAAAMVAGMREGYGSAEYLGFETAYDKLVVKYGRKKK